MLDKCVLTVLSAAAARRLVFTGTRAVAVTGSVEVNVQRNRLQPAGYENPLRMEQC